MKPTLQRLWMELIENLESKTGNIHEFINGIIIWLSTNLVRFDKTITKKYGLHKYTNIILDDYPIFYCGMNAFEELQQMKKVPPSNMEAFAMDIGEIIWQTITYRSKVICPVCKTDELKILFDPNAPLPALVLACDRCTWTQWPDGRKWKGLKVVVPAKKDQLRKGGYLIEE